MVLDNKVLVLEDETELHLSVHENGSNAWIIVNHGLGEHSARHHYMLKIFSQYFNILLYDLRGHGKSSGKRGYVDSFKQYTNDLGEVVSYLEHEYNMKKYILFGHSMGGLIVSSFIQNNLTNLLKPEKVFLSGPAVSPAGKLGELTKFISKSFFTTLGKLPSFPLTGVIDIKKLSHDPGVHHDYIKDSLNVQKPHLKLYLEIASEGKDVFSRPLRCECPLYVALGAGDVLINPFIANDYFENFEKNAHLLMIDDAYHEMHNEISKYRDVYFDFLQRSIMEDLYF